MEGYWQGRSVFITGAGGFIASHLVEALVLAGAQVRAYVRYNSRGDPGLLKLIEPDIQKRVDIIAGDLRDLPAITSAMRGADIVYHLGALISIPYSYRHPVEVVETNIIGTMNALLAGKECQVERIVHTSSSEVYGTALQVPITEAHPLQGQSPYSASKIGADKLVESFYLSYGLPVVTLRPFNTYGPRQSGRAVVPAIILQALSQDVVYLGNLDARRDLTYVRDTVEGFLLVGEIEGIEGEVFNLGVGAEVAVGELAEEIIGMIGRPVSIQVDPARLRPEKSEVMRLLSDNQLARERLGWRPQTSLRDGLQCTIAWMKENIQYYRPETYEI